MVSTTFAQRQALAQYARDQNLMPIWRGSEIWYVMDRRTFDEAQVQGPPEDPEILRRRRWARLHAKADSAKCVAKTYFIGGDVGAIKIGYSVDTIARLRAIQYCSPIPLAIMATAPGGEVRESAYHDQFSEHRMHGEWFERHPDILAEIDRLNGHTS